MPRKNIKKVPGDNFIPGIYNYCDRWCEKCLQKSRCLTYVLDNKLKTEGLQQAQLEYVHSENKNVWTYLKNIFDSTYEILQELAVEKGIEVEEIYTSENLNKNIWEDEIDTVILEEYENDNLILNSEIINIYLIYERWTVDCLEKLFKNLNSKTDKSNKIEDRKISDALDTINWYLDIIHSKLLRAMYIFHSSKKDKLLIMNKQEEYNGAAKVTLISIENSLNAWNILAQNCSFLRKEISHLNVVLKQLSQDVESHFPEARNFLRPGFEI